MLFQKQNYDDRERRDVSRGIQRKQHAPLMHEDIVSIFLFYRRYSYCVLSFPVRLRRLFWIHNDADDNIDTALFPVVFHCVLSCISDTTLPRPVVR